MCCWRLLKHIRQYCRSEKLYCFPPGSSYPPIEDRCRFQGHPGYRCDEAAPAGNSIRRCRHKIVRYPSFQSEHSENCQQKHRRNEKYECFRSAASHQSSEPKACCQIDPLMFPVAILPGMLPHLRSHSTIRRDR